MPPFGIRPVVCGDFVFIPPTEIEPEAIAYILPSPALSGVTTKFPPASDFASPIDDTLMSILLPVFENSGRLAVTRTTATFFESISFVRFKPSLLNIFLNVAFAISDLLSPVPFKPVTTPYPTRGLLLTPFIWINSFILVDLILIFATEANEINTNIKVEIFLCFSS